jgi:hypothetical protein
VKVPRRDDLRFVQMLGAEAARRRALAVVLDRRVAAVVDAALEHEGRALAGVARNARDIDAFAADRGEQKARHRVVAEAALPADRKAQPRQADRHVRLRAGGALREARHLFKLACAVGHEHHHRFAEGRDVNWCAVRICHLTYPKRSPFSP